MSEYTKKISKFKRRRESIINTKFQEGNVLFKDRLGSEPQDTLMKTMTFREAEVDDIKQIQRVRNSVTENTLANPEAVTDKDCEEYLTRRGKGWVCIINQEVVGFSIADLKEYNIWALFVHPEFENRGIGKTLHDRMLDWYFNQTTKTVWLGTSPNTRAENFYRKVGWIETGKHGKGEIRFEMTYQGWTSKRQISPYTIKNK